MKKNEKKVLFCIFLLIIFLRIPTFYQSVFDIDETFFSQFAQSIVSGQTPYLEAADNKFPLMLYWMAGIYWLTGSSSLIIIHIATSLILILTAFLLYKTGEKVKNPSAGLLAAFIFAILSHVYEPKNVSANIETFFNLFFAAGLYFYFRSWKQPKKIYSDAALTGLFTGIAMLTSVQAIFIPLIILFFEIIDFFLSSEKSKITLFLKKAAVLAIGAICVLIPLTGFLIYFYKIGTLDSFLFWGIEHNHRYAQIGAKTVSYVTTFSRLGLFIICSFPAWLAAFFYFKKMRSNVFLEARERKLSIDTRIYLFLLLSLILYLYSIILGKRSYGHYFLLLFLPLSLAGAMYLTDKISLESLSQNFVKLLKPIRKWLLTFLALACIFTIPRISLPCMYETVHNSFGKADMEYRQAAVYLKNRVSQNTPVLAWGFATPIYYYSGMSPATRFLSVDTLTGRLSVPDSMAREEINKLTDQEIQTKLWKWFWQDMEKHPPVYIIDTSPANYYGYSRFSIDSYPDLKKYLDQFYSLETELHLFKIYKRKQTEKQG